MFPAACLQHWYESMIFFGPVPIIGIWVWLSGRRHLGEEDPQDERAPSSPSRPLA
jgi:hypothetical protein